MLHTIRKNIGKVLHLHAKNIADQFGDGDNVTVASPLDFASRNQLSPEDRSDQA